MDSADWIIPYVKQQRLVMDYMCVSAAVLFIYDYILTLKLEIKLIWYSPWNYTKVLFLQIRYLTFVDTFLILYYQITPNLPAKWCEFAFPAAMWIATLKMFLAEVVLAIRTWAVWHRNRAVGIGLAALTIGNLITQCVINGITLSKHALEYESPLYPGFRGCHVEPLNNGALLPNYAALTGVEAIVLALMIISAFRSYKHGHMGEFSHVIHRDAIMFYVVLLSISVANVAIPLALPNNYYDTLTVLTPLEEVLYSILTARIMLNIRDQSYQGSVTQTELHTGYNDSSLVFERPVRRYGRDERTPSGSLATTHDEIPMYLRR